MKVYIRSNESLFFKLALACFLVCAGSAALAWLSQDSALRQVALATSFTFLVLAVLCWLLAKRVARLIVEFRKVMKLTPPADEEERVVMQPGVNTVLKEAAEEIRRRHEVKRVFLEQWSRRSLATEQEVGDGLHELLNLREGIAVAERTFEVRRTLMGRFGFQLFALEEYLSLR